MAMIYSSLGSVYQDLKQWQLSRDYFRREMSCRIGLGIPGDIEVKSSSRTNRISMFDFLARLFSM